MSSLKAGPARPCAANSCTIATSTPCCACRPACSTPKGSRPTSSSSTRNRPRKPRGPRKLWIYDLRTNIHFTLKTNPLKRADLDEFVKNYNPTNRQDRNPTWSEDNQDGRWRAYDYDEIINRDKASLDIFWLKDESLEDSDNLPEPGIIAAEIIEDLQAALEQFKEIAIDLGDQELG